MDDIRFRKTSDNIYYLYDYIPKNQGNQDEISQRILALKNTRDNNEIELVTNKLSCALLREFDGNVKALEGWMICLVPSHDCNEWGYSLTQVASRLASKFKMIDATKLLIRYKYHVKCATAGIEDRSIKSHMDTIKVSNSIDLNGKKVIVLDDITTTGGSLKACKELLKDSGIKTIALIAIGKTMKKDSYDDYDYDNYDCYEQDFSEDEEYYNEYLKNMDEDEYNSYINTSNVLINNKYGRKVVRGKNRSLYEYAIKQLTDTKNELINIYNDLFEEIANSHSSDLVKLTEKLKVIKGELEEIQKEINQLKEDLE